MLLEVSDLKIEFATDQGILRAVDGLSFSLERGRMLGIVGESGCGKSVTALSLMRLLHSPPARVTGDIVLEGRNLMQLSAEEVRKVRGKEMAMIFQEPMTSLNPVFTIGYQISEALRVHRPDWTAARARERSVELLSKVGIAEPSRRYDAYPHEMSGGMRQRVMIAMALACEPKILVADEPTTALDVTIQAQILDLIRNLQKEMGMSVILITHDLGIVSELVDDVMVMYAGKAVEKATSKKLFSEPLHPYTLGLLGSLPRMNAEYLHLPPAERPRLQGIKGAVPNLISPPPGCKFAERCGWVKPHCKETDPLLELHREAHWARCFEVKDA